VQVQYAPLLQLPQRGVLQHPLVHGGLRCHVRDERVGEGPPDLARVPLRDLHQRPVAALRHAQAVPKHLKQQRLEPGVRVLHAAKRSCPIDERLELGLEGLRNALAPRAVEVQHEQQPKLLRVGGVELRRLLDLHESPENGEWETSSSGNR
jgi:hypothetical protein